MLTSQFEYLRAPNIITLCAGHGGTDPGAVAGNHIEAQDNINTTNRIADNLKRMGIDVYVVPHELDLVGAINHVNSKFQWGQTWALEIHRDSANGINQEAADRRIGVYGFGQYTGQDGKFYNEDVRSMNVARFMRDRMVQLGAESNSWARTDNSASFGRLGWIRDTKPAAHLIELGFVQGDNSIDHLNWLADLATTAIYEAFTGNPAPRDKINVVLSNNQSSTNLSAKDLSINILRNYADLPINIPTLETLINQDHPDQAIDQILASFRKNINDFKASSNQKDVWIAQRDQLISNLQNSSNSSSDVNQLRSDLNVANQQKENYRQQLANLVTSFDQLQADFANYKRNSIGGNTGSNGIQPMSFNGGSSVSKLSFTQPQNNNAVSSGVLSTSPNTQGSMTISSTSPVSQAFGTNSSTKPFWQSKKFGANILSAISSVGLITWQTAQIKPEDTLPIIATKLGTALAGVVGISFVSNQYIKAQGKVDEASFGQLAATVLQQVLGK